MIDFSTLKGVTIPEGVVTQIAKDGVVLWSADDGMRTITLYKTYDYLGSGTAEIIFNPTGQPGLANMIRYQDSDSCMYFDGYWESWTSPATIEVPVDTVVSYSLEAENAACEVIINGSVVYSDNSDYVWYEGYTVTKNATITMAKQYQSDPYFCNVYTLNITEQ